MASANDIGGPYDAVEIEYADGDSEIPLSPAFYPHLYTSGALDVSCTESTDRYGVVAEARRLSSVDLEYLSPNAVDQELPGNSVFLY